ncbi:MAG TPA: MarP family serine protease [Cryptosporangiaceae bacterium]|nr:MarP family serine protease [Cryptosporangiaceae bacterium]
MYASLLDVVLVVAMLVFAVSGYRQGFVVGALSFVGFFGGALLGVQMAPLVAGIFETEVGRLASALAVVFALAIGGQALAVMLGSRLRQRLRGRSVQVVDNIGGAVVSVIALLLVAWMVATPLAKAPAPALAGAVRRSAVINAVDTVMPDGVRNLYSGFGDVVQDGDFPEVFGPLTPTDVRSVQPPNGSLAGLPVVRKVRPAVVKVTGVARACERRLEGSGFVYAPQRVMTNAHVVAGVQSVRVESSGQRYDARVVVYDAEKDLAVLYVPGLDVRPLAFDGSARPNADAIVLGYPLDGPYTATPARIRDKRTITGPNIYSTGSVRRQVYTLRSHVRSGNSGGPLLAPDGRVYGVIFAAAADDPQTGFALTVAEAAPVARQGRGTTTRVSTQTCD